MGGTALSALSLYSYQRGLRYPILSWEPSALSDSVKLEGGRVILKDAIHVKEHTIRAIAPEPVIRLESASSNINFNINNVATNAKLTVTGDNIESIDEQKNGLERTISISTKGDSSITLKWQLELSDGFEFAIMGDTGGGSELTWTLKRAHQLGAQFLLHLGDINYIEGEYQAAIAAFNTAQIPSYITIGNHDFHDNGLIYQRFLNELGPLNCAFELAGTRFINIDTAADFFPAHSGLRGQLFKQLKQTPFNGEQVFFSHRPLKDPRPHDDHEVGGIKEIDWLSNSIKSLGGKHYMHGHVHHSAELDFDGLHQLSIGEGLGHEDLVLQKHVAQIMMAKVEPNTPLSHRWVDLNMPWSLHQSPTHIQKLKRDKRGKQIKWFQEQLAKEPSLEINS